VFYLENNVGDGITVRVLWPPRSSDWVKHNAIILALKTNWKKAFKT